MGDVDGGDAQFLLDPPELELHLFAQFFIQRRQRLVEKQQIRAERKCSGNGDALLLAA